MLQSRMPRQAAFRERHRVNRVCIDRALPVGDLYRLFGTGMAKARRAGSPAPRDSDRWLFRRPIGAFTMAASQGLPATSRTGFSRGFARFFLLHLLVMVRRFLGRIGVTKCDILRCH